VVEGPQARRCRTARAIGGFRLVVDHMRPCVLETRAIRFNDIQLNSGKISLKPALPARSVL